jgi:FkbM family methyltransferase
VEQVEGISHLIGSGLIRLLKRWRDNYYLSLLLASIAKPLHFVCTRVALELHRKVHKNSVTVRLPNGKDLRFAKDAGVGIASLLFWNGLDGYEPETSLALRALFELAGTFVDVGANYGLYSILGALWNPALRVIAFEPYPPICEGLKKNVQLNRLQERVLCENLALASEAGKATFFIPNAEGKDLESTGTLATDSWQARKGSPQVQVDTVRFDEYESQHPIRVDLVKINVEDFEAAVLRGMQGVIRRDLPFIVCEILPRKHHNQATHDIVKTLNYQPYWITPLGYIRVFHFDFERKDCNNFLLSPVSTPEVVESDLGVLWDLRQQAIRTQPDRFVHPRV